jgi:hypothetical protein
MVKVYEKPCTDAAGIANAYEEAVAGGFTHYAAVGTSGRYGYDPAAKTHYKLDNANSAIINSKLYAIINTTNDSLDEAASQATTASSEETNVDSLEVKDLDLTDLDKTIETVNDVFSKLKSLAHLRDEKEDLQKTVLTLTDKIERIREILNT